VQFACDVNVEHAGHVEAAQLYPHHVQFPTEAMQRLCLSDGHAGHVSNGQMHLYPHHLQLGDSAAVQLAAVGI
jgi:hypothetical protein